MCRVRVTQITCMLLVGISVGCVPSTVEVEGTHQPSIPTSQVMLSVTALAEPDNLISTPAPLATATATPETTASPNRPTPLPTPTLPPVMVNSLNNFDYGVTWAVPTDWWDISDSLRPPTHETQFWQAWASSPEAELLLSSSPPVFPLGLMLLTLNVEPATSESQQSGEASTTLWGQPIWKQETNNSDSAPFALRLAFLSVRPPYQYTFALDCAPPGVPDALDQDAFIVQCRHVWDFVSFSFGLCALPKNTSGETTAWQHASNNSYRYAFEVPGDWLMISGVTADRLSFFSDADVFGQPNSCSLPNGLMKLDFAADPPGNFGTGAPNSAPDTEGFTETTIAEHAAWIQTVQGGEAVASSTTVTQAYIQGQSFWYTVYFSCTSPTDADVETQSSFKLQCEEVLSQILGSFQVVEP